ESVAKHYRYLLLCDPVRDPFLDGLAWRLESPLDDSALARAQAEAALAVGTYDFSAFRSSADERVKTVRTLHALAVSIEPTDRRLVRIDVRGTAFLHNMVRILVGTIVDVARGRVEPGAVLRALASRQRRDAGVTAPPDGLYLEQVILGNEGADPWPP